MMKLKINGQDKSFSAEDVPGTITQLLEQMEIDAATVVAEVDGQIVERKDFVSRKLEDGQVIELIRFVGGG